MIDPKDALMSDPDLIGPGLMERYEWRQRRSSMHAIYSAGDEYRCCGFVDSEHRDRVAQFLDPDAGCYAGQLAVSNRLHADTLRGLRMMEGIPSWRL